MTRNRTEGVVEPDRSGLRQSLLRRVNSVVLPHPFVGEVMASRGALENLSIAQLWSTQRAHTSASASDMRMYRLIVAAFYRVRPGHNFGKGQRAPLTVITLGVVEFQLAAFLDAQVVKDGCADTQLIGGLLAGNLVVNRIQSRQPFNLNGAIYFRQVH